MKIVISPSKTMVGYSHPDFSYSSPLLLDKAFSIVEMMKKKSVKDLMKLYDCSEKIAKENFLRFQDFGVYTYHAIFSYTGHQFKNLDVYSLSKEDLDYLQNKLIILSGLYGALKPLDGISMYRLPMDMKIKNRKMSLFFQNDILSYFGDETVVNLASVEYSSSLSNQLNIVTIEFMYMKNGKLKIDSMEAKKMRGLFLRFMAENRVESIEKLFEFNQNGYDFSEENSSSKRLVFLKK